MPDSRSINRLLKSLGNRNVTAIQVGDFRVEFARPEPSTAPAHAVERSPFPAPKAPEPEKTVALIPGTLFFDDDSPINPLDLILNPPPIDSRKVGN